MIRYLKADLWRINRRVPRILLFVMYLVIGVVVVVMNSRQSSYNFVKLGNCIGTEIGLLSPLLTMLNLYFVFEDDMEAKTMQVAIGKGMGRLQIILVKWLEIILLSLFDCVMLLLCTGVAGVCRGVVLKDSGAAHVLSILCVTVLTNAVLTVFIMMIIFYIMQIGLTQVLFIVLSLKPISAMIGFVEKTNEIMAKLSLSRFLIGSNLDGFQVSLEAGQFNLQNFLVIVIYCVIGIGVTYMLFKKKELDF